MIFLPRFPLLLIAVALSPVAIAGCGGGSSSSTATPPAASRTVAATATRSTPVPLADIRSIDLATQLDVQKLVSDTGGQFTPQRVIYADLTRDGNDEAIIPIASGGTLGDIAYIVLTPDVSGAKTLLNMPADSAGDAGVAVTVEDGKLVETRPVYGPTDPNCCPSMLRTTTYAWNGAAMAKESSDTHANPAGAGKTNPTAPAGAPQ